MSAEKRESFVFYRSFAEALEELPPEQFKEAVLALSGYALDEKAPEVQGMARALFVLMKPQVDANRRRYENGKHGGRPKQEPNTNQTETEQEPRTYQEQTEQEPRENQTGTEGKPNANANANANANVNVNDNVNDTPPLPPQGGAGEREETKEVEYPGVKPCINVKEFWSRWSKVPGQPDAGGLMRFNTVTWRKVVDYATGLDPGDVYKAIENYALVRSTPGNAWQTNPTSDKWTRDHIGRFVPGTFNMEDYLDKKPERRADAEWNRIVTELEDQKGAAGWTQ